MKHGRQLLMAGLALGMAVLVLAGAAARLTVAQGGSEPQGPREASGVMSTPEPGSKNAAPGTASQPPLSNPHGMTITDRDRAGTKNAADPQAAPSTAAHIAGDSRGFMACGAAGNLNWTTTSTAWQVIRSCTATFPEAGVVFINATAGVAMQDTAYEGLFGLNVDNATADNSGTDRWVNVYPDSGDGTDKSAAVSWLTPVSAGTHTFYFLGARYTGSGTVLAYDPALSVAYFPATASPVKVCGAAGNANWSTTSAVFVPVVTCTLSVPGPGWVYVNGTASAALFNAPYEVRYHVAVDDNPSETSWPDRWTNVYTDTGDGTDESLADTTLTHIVSGTHTFYFGAERYAGSGTVQLYDPALSVLYFPDDSVVAKTCGNVQASGDWQNSTSSYTVIGACKLDVPGHGFAIVDANASAGLTSTSGGSNWEGQFRVGVDDANGSDAYDRWLNVDTDGNNGTDRVLADSALMDMSAGSHNFYFVGRRYAGSGTVELLRSSLTVLVSAGHTYLPLVLK